MGAREIGALRALLLMLDAAVDGRQALYDPLINARNIARELERTATNRQRTARKRALLAA
ncbi:hypothetical protein [Streptomyces sp. NPDC046805]|uniref:hypothetical protein n=1 Tax=Streptomyces sp. NPDC046805 TaxID=3155134 RepID=UPI0033FF8F1D